MIGVEGGVLKDRENGAGGNGRKSGVKLLFIHLRFK